METAIVTGAGGFIGQAVLRELLDTGYKIYAIVRETGARSLPISDRCVPVACDLSETGEIEKLVPAGEAQMFFHFAWAGVWGWDRVDARLQLANALLAVDSLCLAQKLGCRRFVSCGSLAEYSTVAVLYASTCEPVYRWVYGAAKIAARAICMEKAANMHIEPVWGTFAGAYGPGNSGSALPNVAIDKIIGNQPLEFMEGTQNYDFVYIDDIARALRLIGERGHPFGNYFIGSGQARPLREFLLELKSTIAPGREFKFGQKPFVGPNLPISCFDTEDTARDTGFKPQIDFAEGCRRTYEWALNKQEFAL